MLYNLKEYTYIFDTPQKKQQERVIIEKIMNILNNKKNDNLEEFIYKNENYQNFLKKNNMDTVIKHFGNTLNEQDYKNILENLRKLTNSKNDFDKNNIKKTNIEGEEFITFNGQDKTYYLDNSNTNKSLEEQMRDLQVTQQNFQTNDIKKNTENMISELANTKKETLNHIYLNEINFESLNLEEQKIYEVAKNYQLQAGYPLMIDINRKVIIDKDEIKKIVYENGKYLIISDLNKEQHINKDEKVDTKAKQFTLKPNTNTIYSNN